MGTRLPGVLQDGAAGVDPQQLASASAHLYQLGWSLAPLPTPPRAFMRCDQYLKGSARRLSGNLVMRPFTAPFRRVARPVISLRSCNANLGAKSRYTTNPFFGTKLSRCRDKLQNEYLKLSPKFQIGFDVLIPVFDKLKFTEAESEPNLVL
jgi:hypothetical protein